MRQGVISYTVTVILIAASIVFLGLLAAQFIRSTDKTLDISSCQQSVLMASQSKVLGQPPRSIDCPRREVTIKKKDVLVRGSVSRDAVRGIIARELDACWDKMFGSKQLNPYHQNLVLGSKEVCLICAEIEFDEDLQEALPTLADFREFLDREGYMKQWETPLHVEAADYFPFWWMHWSQEKLVDVDEFDTGTTYYLLYNTYADDWFTDSESWLNKLTDSVLRDSLTAYSYGADRPADTKTSYSFMVLLPEQDLSVLDCDTVKG